MSHTKELYKNTVVKKLQDEFSYGNILEVPKLRSISLNVGIKAVDSDNTNCNVNRSS